MVKARRKIMRRGSKKVLQATAPVIDVDSLPSASSSFNMSGGTSIFDGSKYFGGLPSPQFTFVDHWSLRLHSAKLFKENLYARGLIRRLVTNEIATGLSLEAIPNALILGIPSLDEDKMNTWSEDVEARFQIWANTPELCDYKQKNTFGALQRISRAEALVSGDVLVVLIQSQKTRLPSIHLIPGHKVQTPFGHKPRNGNKIIHGVELDKRGRQVAFWVIQDDSTSKRIAAFGERSGRRIAWLEYGTDKRLDDVRGEPILSLVMQSLKEIDRYRDSVQRKATLNSTIAMYIKKALDKPGTKPFSGGATRVDQTTLDNPDGTTRQFNIAKQLPGLVLEELQVGEEPVPVSSAGTDTDFGSFEATIVNAFAWATEVPPEILTLAFQNNYAASRAAVNEFKIYLNKARSEKSDSFTKPIYIEWLLSEVMIDRIQAPGLLEAWRDPALYDTFGAWTASDWSGAIKPNIDLLKEAKGYKLMDDSGYITKARTTRELTGLKFSQVMKQKKKENELFAEAQRPLLELAREFGVKVGDLGSPSANADTVVGEELDDIKDRLSLVEGGNKDG